MDGFLVGQRFTYTKLSIFVNSACKTPQIDAMPLKGSDLQIRSLSMALLPLVPWENPSK